MSVFEINVSVFENNFSTFTKQLYNLHTLNAFQTSLILFWLQFYGCSIISFTLIFEENRQYLDYFF